MVALKVRTTDDSAAITLGDIPFRPEAFESAVSTIKSWGISIPGGDNVHDEAFGQFVLTETECYFEVVISLDG